MKRLVKKNYIFVNIHLLFTQLRYLLLSSSVGEHQSWAILFKQGYRKRKIFFFLFQLATSKFNLLFRKYPFIIYTTERYLLLSSSVEEHQSWAILFKQGYRKRKIFFFFFSQLLLSSIYCRPDINLAMKTDDQL